MKKFKALLKNVGIGIGIFIGFFVASFLILFTGTNILYEKNLISALVFDILVFAGAFVIGIVSVIVFFIRKKRNKYKLFSDIGSRIGFFAYLFLGFLAAFKKEVILSQESAQKLIEIEWTIFSIAMTVFVFWHVFVSKFIENKPIQGAIGSNRIELLSQKILYYKNAWNFFYNLVLLILAVGCLMLVTASVYLMEVNYFVQFVVVFNIYIVTDALMVIFYDIAMPLCGELILSIKYRMTDQQAIDEIQLAVIENLIKQELKDSDKTLPDDEITKIAIEAIEESKLVSCDSEKKMDENEKK